MQKVSRFNFRLLFLAALVVLTGAMAATGWGQTGALKVEENFNYTAGTNLTANGYSAHSAGGTNPQKVASVGLTYSGYASSGIALADTFINTGEDINKPFASFPNGVTSGSLYYGLLVNLATLGTTADTIDYFFHFYKNTTTFPCRLYARKATNGNFSFGISKAGTAGQKAISDSIYSAGTTYLVVAKYKFVAGLANDTVALWINPSLGTAEPAPTVAEKAGDITAAGSDVDTIYGVAIRQGGGASIEVGGKVDGIRVGTTWEDVTASPAAPTCVTGAATSITTTSATLNGTVNANWESTVVTFDYGTSLSYGTTVTADQSPVIWGANTATSKAITGLTPNQLYHFRDPGTNSIGTTNGADATFTTVPDAPSTSAATSISETGFTANWAPGTGNAPATYTLDVATDAGFTSMVSGYPLSGIVGTSSAVTSLSGGTTYYYRVRGVDVGGTSANSNTTSTLTLPPAPTATAGTSLTPVSFTANWTAPSGTVTGYRLDVSTDIGFSSFVSGYNDVAVAGTSDAVTGLTQSTTYYYRVRAENGSGAGANSNTITVTTQSSTASTSSDVVAISSSESATISSLTNDGSPLSSSQGTQVWKIRVRDGGGSPDADGLPTQLIAVTLTQDSANEVPNWSNAMLAADLFLDSTSTPHLASGTIGATSISFTGFAASAPDDGTKDLILRISLKNPLGSGVADHQHFGFRIINSNVTAGDFSSSSQFATFVKARSDNAQNQISVVATQLTFTTEPPAVAQTSTNISTAVSGTDANGNIDVDYAGTVTLARSAGTGGFYAASTLVHAAASGTAAWSDLRYNTAEAGVTIDGSDGSFTPTTSTAITFNPIVNTQSDILANSGESATVSSIINNPSPLTSAQGTQVWSVRIRDGGVTAPDTDALPTILTGLKLTKNATNSVPDWAAAIRAADLFDGATHLDTGIVTTSGIVFTGFTSSAPDNGTKDLQIRISLKNPLPAGSDGKKFVFSVTPKNDTAAGGSTSSLFDTSAATASSDTSKNVIDVTATKLAFVGSIPNSLKDSAFSATAKATDANGNTDLGFGGSVTFLKAGGPGTLTGNGAVTAVNGVATSSTLKIDTGGRDTLSANSGGLTQGLSNSFVIIGQVVFKVAAGPANVPSAEGGNGLAAVDTLAWDSVSTWQIVSGASLTGIPHSRDSVILDHTNRAAAYVVRVSTLTTPDSCAEIVIGAVGNSVPVGLVVPTKNRSNPAFFFGDGKTGNYDMVIAGGGTFYDLKDTAGSGRGANVFFRSVADSMKIRTGGTWYHQTPGFNTMHQILSRAVDGDYGTVELDVDVSHITGIFDISGGGKYYYPNLTISNTHSFGTYFWFGSGATTIHGNLTVNTGAKDSMMLNGYPFLVGGNIVNNGTIIATSSSLVFAGTSPQTVSGNPMTLNAGLTTFNSTGTTFNSDVNITGGTVQTTGTFTYDSSGLPTNVTRNVLGTFNMGANTMNLNPAGALNEGANPVQGNVTATRTASQNVNQTFSGIGYEINAAGGSPGSTVVTRKTGAGSTSTANGHQSIKRYYDVTPTSNYGLNATIGVSYATTELNGINEASLSLQQSTNAGATWSGQNGSVSVGLHKITAAPVNHLSRWTAASVDSQLFVSHTITVRKYADADGDFNTTGDQALKKWRLALYKDTVQTADSISGGNPVNGTLAVSNLAAGTYIAVEADSTSSGWTSLGKIHHGVRVATTTHYDTVTVSGGVSDSADFINHGGTFTANTIRVRKFVDSDGQFATSNDRAAKVWYLEVRDTSGNTLYGSTTDTAFTVVSLADQQYVVREADSTGWVHLGSIVNGVPVSGSGNSVTLTLSGGQQHATVDFVNAAPTYSVRYRGFREDSLANDVDNKGKVGKFVKRKTDKVDFVAMVVNDTGTVVGLHMEFGAAIMLNFPFYTVPTSSHASDGKNKKWDFTFSAPVHHGDTVLVYGFGNKGKPQKVGKYYWENGITLVGTKKKDPTFLRNDPKYPMPNRVNALFETFAQTGFGATGLLVGRDRSADSAKQYGWILAPKYTDVLKSLKDKTGLHTGSPQGFSNYTSTGKPILKGQKSIPPSKQNNVLIADLITLKLNIAASTLAKTPIGFGELLYNDSAYVPTTSTVNFLNGKMVKEISAYADTVMMGKYAGTTHVFANDSVFKTIDYAVSRINSAFEGAVDTIDFAVKLHMTGTKRLADVPYLHANPGVIPAVVIPLDKPIVETPQQFKLYQNYPNPFNPTTTIQFDLVDPSVVTLKIYNILGQEIATLLDHATLDDGTQEIDFNAANFASGVYIYRLITETVANPDDGIDAQKFTSVKKMLLIK
jgi:hypothetical protein